MAAINLMFSHTLRPNYLTGNSPFPPTPSAPCNKSKILIYFTIRIYIRKQFYVDQGFENGRSIFSYKKEIGKLILAHSNSGNELTT